MRSLSFDELFAMLSAVDLSPGELGRLREWIASIAHPAECIALIEQAARGRPCPHCSHPRAHRCGQASGLQRFRCLRCRRSGRESASRLIGRMRLIRQHTICVSCYNREREVLRGRNAKGAPPRKWAGLYFTHISYVKAGQPRRCERLAVPVLDRIEAALLMLRRDGVQSVYFAAREPVRSACAA